MTRTPIGVGSHSSVYEVWTAEKPGNRLATPVKPSAGLKAFSLAGLIRVRMVTHINRLGRNLVDFISQLTNDVAVDSDLLCPIRLCLGKYIAIIATMLTPDIRINLIVYALQSARFKDRPV